MSKLKLSMAKISQDDIQTARENRKEFTQYSGPTPPPGNYKVKVNTLLLSQAKAGPAAGHDQITVFCEVLDEGYAGAPVSTNLTIPFDSSHQYFSIHVSVLDSALLALSGGTMSISGFVEAANKGQIHAEDTKSGKAKKITQIGKFKTDKIPELEAFISNWTDREGNVRAQIKYFAAPPKGSQDSVNEGTSEAESDDFSLDDDDLDLG